MASPYYIEPVNILPGLQMLGEGLNRRAEMARQNAARAEEAENMKLAEEAIKSGDPDAVNAAMLKNPKLEPVFRTIMGIKDKQDIERETKSIIRILSETDPTAKANIIIEEAEAAKEAGEDIKPFVDMGIMATRGDVKGIDNKLLMMLSTTNKDAYGAYKEQAGIGKDKNLSQIRYDYEKAKTEGYEGDFLKYVKDFKAAERAPEKPVVEPLSQEGKWLKEQAKYKKGSKEWNFYQKRLDKAITISGGSAGSGVVGTDADTKDIAAAIISGKLPPTTVDKVGRKESKQIAAELARSGVDLTSLIIDYKAVQKRVSSMNTVSQQRLWQATNFASESLDLVVDLAKQWKNGGFPSLNKARMVAAKQGLLGPKAQSIATRLENQISDLQSDLSVVYKGGNSPTDQGLQHASKQLRGEWSESTLLDNVGLARKSLNLRLKSMESIPTMGGSSNNIYVPKTGPGPKPAPTGKGKPAKPKSDPLGIR